MVAQVYMDARGYRIRMSGPVLAAYQVCGQPELHETLKQQQK